MKVSDVMTSDVRLCTPEHTVRDAADAMAKLDVGCCRLRRVIISSAW